MVFQLKLNNTSFLILTPSDALAEWLRRVPAKYMGFPRESSNLSGVASFFIFVFPFFWQSNKNGGRVHSKLNERITLDIVLFFYCFPSSKL
jgi:hypothetical protein